VESNLLNKKAKLEALRKNKTKKEHVRSLEVKLDILANTVNKMMQKISRKDELVVQISHVSLVPEKKNLTDHKQFASHPCHSKTKDDCFMYSIHNVVKDEVPTHLVEETSTDMMYMFDDISFMDDLPKHN
jgi:seryl-tRNA synthetase